MPNVSNSPKAITGSNSMFNKRYSAFFPFYSLLILEESQSYRFYLIYRIPLKSINYPFISKCGAYINKCLCQMWVGSTFLLHILHSLFISCSLSTSKECIILTTETLAQIDQLTEYLFLQKAPPLPSPRCTSWNVVKKSQARRYCKERSSLCPGSWRTIASQIKLILS